MDANGYELLSSNGLLQNDSKLKAEEQPISIKGLKLLTDDFLDKNQNDICINYIQQEDIINEGSERIAKIECYMDNINSRIISLESELYDQFPTKERKEELKQQIKELAEQNQILNQQKYQIKMEYLKNDTVCKKILNFQKQINKLNFFIIVGFPITHSSIVLNYDDKYFFLDSTSTFDKRWPSNQLIGEDGQLFK